MPIYHVLTAAALLAPLTLAAVEGHGVTVGPTTGSDRVETPAERDARMAWWREAKFGMFIHWGIYAVPAGVYGEKTGYGEWILRNSEMSVAEYKAYADGFTAEHYNPDEWTQLAHDAGMRYIVITSKHHDGFALYPSAVSDWDVVDATPHGKDLLGPLVDAARARDLNIGFYYSQAQDWTHPGGGKARMKEGDGWDPAHKGDFDAYLNDIALPQVREILTTYEPDILWWDTPTWMNPQRCQPFVDLLALVPDIVTNNRLGIGGDTSTPEQFVPVTGVPGDWETCMTLNHYWGYNAADKNWKSAEDLIHKLANICAKGGNFLLNVGPTADGRIPQGSIDRLREVGAWMDVYGEAIYGTTAGPFPYLSWGTATRKGDRLYLHVFDWPSDGILRVPVDNDATGAHLVNDPASKLTISREPGRLVLSVPQEAPHPINSVIALDIVDEPVVKPILSLDATATADVADPKAGPEHTLDGKRHPGWKLPKGVEAGTLTLTLPQAETVGAIGVDELDMWPRLKQTYRIEALVDGSWQQQGEGKSHGHGFKVNFPAPVLTDQVRIHISGTHPRCLGLDEVQLYRPE
ncbi:MAG: alpha-L-fucosidase [Planctomycetota bacterium]|jgi:alpha-L-fucosidase